MDQLTPGLADCGIDDQGCRALADAIGANTTLDAVDLSCECGWVCVCLILCTLADPDAVNKIGDQIRKVLESSHPSLFSW